MLASRPENHSTLEAAGAIPLLVALADPTKATSANATSSGMFEPSR